MRRFFKVLLGVVLFGIVLSTGGVSFGADEVDEATRQRVLSSYGNLPLYFVENSGQLDSQVRYYTKTPGQSIYFTPEKIVVGLSR